MTKTLSQHFHERFQQTPLLFIAPGRINLIGEHTDYNHGFVMPAAINKSVYFAIAPVPGKDCKVIALDRNEEKSFSIQTLEPCKDWSTYLKGVYVGFRELGIEVPAVQVVFTSTVPEGAGLSSSAALSCGFAFALNQLAKSNLDRLTLAKIAQQAEHKFAGVKCGIMDQYASLFGKKDAVVLLDCQQQTHSYFPLHLKDHTLLLVDTRVKHSLASSAYNKRREACEEGVRIIQAKHAEVKSLRDVSSTLLATFRSQLQDETFVKCNYVVGEIDRTLRAAELLMQHKLEEFGALMYETHEGLSIDYEVSCDELDFLVRLAKKHNVTGARMMGGGFGGCTINLIRKDTLEIFKDACKNEFVAKFKIDPAFYEVTPEEGVHQINI